MESGNLLEWVAAVAECVSAVGTVGAFAAALIIWRHDVGRQNRSVPDKLITYQEVINTKHGLKTRLTIRNISNTPFENLQVVEHPRAADANPNLFHSMRLVPGFPGVLHPGGSTTHVLPPDGESVVILTFTDSNGHDWARMLRPKGPRYVSQARVKRALDAIERATGRPPGAWAAIPVEPGSIKDPGHGDQGDSVSGE